MRISDWSSDVCSSDLLDLLAGRNDLAGVDVLLDPRHFADVDQAFDARFQLDEGAVIGDVGDGAGELRADRIFGRHAFPRIAFELLHAQADALRVAVDADDRSEGTRLNSSH